MNLLWDPQQKLPILEIPKILTEKIVFLGEVVGAAEEGDDALAAVDVAEDAAGGDQAGKTVAVIVGVGGPEGVDAH